jgi:hypothetical protein
MLQDFCEKEAPVSNSLRLPGDGRVGFSRLATLCDSPLNHRKALEVNMLTVRALPKMELPRFECRRYGADSDGLVPVRMIRSARP